MPIYEFLCRSCGDHFDKLVSSDWKNSNVTCPVCGSAKLERLVSMVGAFQTDGKIQTLNSHGDACKSCSGGSCSSCN